MPEYKLMKHQKQGVKFLDKMNGVGALLYEPGVGKTGTTLWWADRQAEKRGEFRILVIAPPNANDTWVLQAPPFMDSMVKARVLSGSTVKILEKIRDSRDWSKIPTEKIGVDHVGSTKAQVSGNRTTILSVSSGALSNYAVDHTNRLRVKQAIRKYAPHLIVVDESHLIKSATSNVSKMAYFLWNLAPHRIILTGTVNPLSPLDCYGQWRFMAPWTFSDQHGMKFTKKPHHMKAADVSRVKPWSWTMFSRRYAEIGGFKGDGIGSMKDSMEGELRDRVAERSHVVLKKDAMDLPPVVDVDVYVKPTAKEAKAYEDMAAKLAAEVEDGSMLEAKNGAIKIMKLRQITAGFLKDSDTGEIHWIGKTKQKRVVDLVHNQLEGERRVVVGAYFKPECQAYVEALRKNGTVVEVITGKTKRKERLAIRQRFGDLKNHPERIVLVAQVSTMAVSVNELVTAQNIVIASLSGRRDEYVQFRGRFDRKGQKGEKVTFWNVMFPESIDGIVRDRHEDRGDMEASLLDHVKAYRKK